MLLAACADAGDDYAYNQIRFTRSVFLFLLGTLEKLWTEVPPVLLLGG